MLIEMPPHPPLPDRLVEGRSYERPCVRAQWNQFAIAWVPVIGSIHQDIEHVRADFDHIHVDYRFLPGRVREKTEAGIDHSASIFRTNPVHSEPISSVFPVGTEGPITLADAAKMDTALWLRVEERIYAGPYPEYPTPFVPWMRELSRAYAGARLIDGTICPHQGTDLAGIEPDQQGNITCPLHGLCWNAKTGRMARQA